VGRGHARPYPGQGEGAIGQASDRDLALYAGDGRGIGEIRREPTLVSERFDELQERFVVKRFIVFGEDARALDGRSVQWEAGDAAGAVCAEMLKEADNVIASDAVTLHDPLQLGVLRQKVGEEGACLHIAERLLLDGQSKGQGDAARRHIVGVVEEGRVAL